MSSDDKPSFQIPTSVLARQVDQQMVLLNLASEQYFGLDEVGTNIVKRLTEKPFDEALTALEGEYTVEPDVLRRDVHTLVDQLVQAGLLVRVDP